MWKQCKDSKMICMPVRGRGQEVGGAKRIVSIIFKKFCCQILPVHEHDTPLVSRLAPSTPGPAPDVLALLKWKEFLAR